MRLPRHGNLLKNAHDLRQNMTAEERKLWYLFLCHSPVHFRRQQIVGSCIVDFYCHSRKLVIELDGSQHFEGDGQINDAERDAFFHSKGITVLRYSNADINQRFESVCEDIHLRVTARIEAL